MSIMHRSKRTSSDVSLSLLEVRTRSTVRPGGQVSKHESVHCPRRDTTMSVRDCLLCVDCDGMHRTDDGVALICRRAEAEDTTPGRRRRPTQASRLRLSAIMTGNIVCVRPNLTIEALASLFVDRRISGAPVVDDEGRPIGVVSKSDLVRARVEDGTAASADSWRPEDAWNEPGFHLVPQSAGTVADIMMPLAFTLPEEATLSQAAAIMAYEGVHRVPVVSGDGAIVGIVSAIDVVKRLADHDRYAV
jgi:CBS domain-containing protein